MMTRRMTIRQWARMLNPDLEMIICRGGEPIGRLMARNASESDFADNEVLDWMMHSVKMMAKVDIR